MKNYHYIVASLPEVVSGAKTSRSAGEIISDIRELCDEKDAALVDFLSESFSKESLTEEFYQKALSSRNAFIREYFAFDLQVRNAKVRYLNAALGRPAEKDVMAIEQEEFEKSVLLSEILAGKDILERERALDDLYWEKLDELSLLHYFDMNVVMAFILKLHIVDRWNTLDEATGRELFKKLVGEVMETFAQRREELLEGGK